MFVIHLSGHLTPMVSDNAGGNPSSYPEPGVDSLTHREIKFVMNQHCSAAVHLPHQCDLYSCPEARRFLIDT